MKIMSYTLILEIKTDPKDKIPTKQRLLKVEVDKKINLIVKKQKLINIMKIIVCGMSTRVGGLSAESRVPNQPFSGSTKFKINIE